MPALSNSVSSRTRTRSSCSDWKPIEDAAGDFRAAEAELFEPGETARAGGGLLVQGHEIGPFVDEAVEIVGVEAMSGDKSEQAAARRRMTDFAEWYSDGAPGRTEESRGRVDIEFAANGELAHGTARPGSEAADESSARSRRARVIRLADADGRSWRRLRGVEFLIEQ